MIFRRKQIQVLKRTAAQAGQDAVAGLRNSFYCEHGVARSSCQLLHVGGRIQARES